MVLASILDSNSTHSRCLLQTTTLTQTTQLLHPWVRANENQAITRTDNCLDDTNWTVLAPLLMLMLQICGVQGYALSAVQCPDPSQDPEGANNGTLTTPMLES